MLRERLNPEEMGIRQGPSLFKAGENRYALRCRECAETYYVDDAIMHHVLTAIEGDPSENPFCCPRCEDEFAEEEHRH